MDKKDLLGSRATGLLVAAAPLVAAAALAGSLVAGGTLAASPRHTVVTASGCVPVAAGALGQLKYPSCLGL